MIKQRDPAAAAKSRPPWSANLAIATSTFAAPALTCCPGSSPTPPPRCRTRPRADRAEHDPIGLPAFGRGPASPVAREQLRRVRLATSTPPTPNTVEIAVTQWAASL